MIVLFAFLASWLLPQVAQAGLQIPGGFILIRSSVGVQLYKKDYPNGYPDYMQVIRLDRGAEVRLLHGEVSHQGVTSGVYGGMDVRFTSRSIVHYWEEILSNTRRAFCVTNGQFFYMHEYPTRLPFPLKVDDKIVSGGYSRGEFAEQKYMLELWKDRADIRLLSKVDFQNSTAPNIIAGLAEDARKSPNKYVGRTFVGVADQNMDGVYETLLIFSTQASRQRDAADMLRMFGAKEVMMLDGGLSTQLVCQGKPYIQTERLIPQAIAVLDGTRPYLKQPQAKPTPMQPKHEFNQVQSQNERLSFAPEEQSKQEEFNTTLVVKVENKEPEAAARIHLSDVVFVPITIFLVAGILAGILRRLWLRY